MGLDFVQKVISIGGATTEPTLRFYRKGFNLGGSSLPSWQDIILSGNTALTLVNAKADELNYLKLFGGCEQNGVPTPTTPMDIVCNNGVLKVIRNLIDLNAVTDRHYYNPQGVYSSSSTARLTDYIPIKVGKSVTIYFKSLATASNMLVRINIFDSNKVWQSQEVLQLSSLAEGTTIITPTYNGYIRVSGNYKGSAIVDWDTAKIVYGEYTVATIDSAIGSIYIDGTTETVEVKGKNLFDTNIIVLNKSISSWGEILDQSDRCCNAVAINILPSTTYTLSYDGANNGVFYYTEDDTFISYLAWGEAPRSFTAPSNAYKVRFSFESDIIPTNLQLELGSTATTYEPYYYGGQATAENLFKVGTYQDVQSVLDGQVTRNVGVKVLDGTESWTQLSNDRGYFTATVGLSGLPMSSSLTGFSTHFKYYYWQPPQSTDRPMQGVNMFGYNGSSTNTNGNLTIKPDLTVYDTVDKWVQYLASQYNAGTPVIVVYPLATAITETVTAQPLTIQAGTNIVEITQASIDNLPLEVSYKGTV